MSVLFIAEQGGTTGGRVKTRHAQPFDRTMPADERDCFAVSDHRKVFKRGCHIILFWLFSLPPHKFLTARADTPATATKVGTSGTV